MQKKKHEQTVEERKQGRKRKQLLAPTPMKIRVALEQVDPDIVADTGLAQQTVHASAGRRAGELGLTPSPNRFIIATFTTAVMHMVQTTFRLGEEEQRRPLGPGRCGCP